MVESLLEFGPAEPGGTPVSFREIEAWASLTRTVLPGWEVRFLRELSLTYCQELHRATDPQRAEPSKAETTRDAVADQFRSFLNLHREQR